MDTTSTTISDRDADALKPLAEAVARIAALPVQEQKRALWKRLNALRDVRPLVHICQEPWREFAGREYNLRCAGQLARQVEEQLHQKLWRWRHAPADDVVEPEVWTPAVCAETPWGLPLRPRTPDGAVEYPPLIRSPDDVARIAMPEIRYDPAATGAKAHAIARACGGMIRAQPVVSLAPALWDLLVQWYGTTELMQDLVENPALVHAAARRCTDMILHRMRQFEDQEALCLNNRGGAGSGGLAYTDELPQPDFEGRVRLRDLWGNQMAQIFVGVSPEMHEEFALRYEIEILQHFGLNCYGCCEPLHRKVHVVRKIPRLRRISMSPWVNWEEGAAAVGRDFVFSAKPNPAFLAAETWNPAPARDELTRVLAATRGLHVELVLKDIHTLRGDPARLVAWHRMAMELVDPPSPTPRRRGPRPPPLAGGRERRHDKPRTQE
jgi:hypothetical protein